MDENMILPDDFATPQAETEVQDTQQKVDFAEDTTEAIEPQEQTQTEVPEVKPEVTQEPRIKVKFNHEERELSLEEARELAQKGLNYDKVTEKLKSYETDPRLNFVEELAREQGMTTEQYLQAAQEWREQQKLNELIQKNIPEELAKEILENRKYREQQQKAEAEKQKKEAQDKAVQDEYMDFIQAFPDVKQEEIPKEVWDSINKGVPMKFAYMQHENSTLKNQIQILKQNQENLKKAPVGGVTVHGNNEPVAEDPFLQGFNSI